MGTSGQPADEWDYLRRDDDDEPDEPPGAEEGALHEDEGGDERRPALDPGRADDGAEVDDEPDALPEDHYPDEEPEQVRWRAPAEHEPDLEEILESQHYAFPDGERDDET